MFTDSHCHLTYPDLSGRFPEIRQAMAEAGVTRALCVCTTLEEFEAVDSLAESDEGIWATVGVHPDNEGVAEPTLQDLAERAGRPRVVAIGETGLDYYQMDARKGGRSIAEMEWQRDRFRTHILAARRTRLPLVIHTRDAADDTLGILRELGEDGTADAAGGVFHCFAETADVARAALDMGFYISFSGIVTFKSARQLRDIAAFVPDDRLLIETDSPYLAPVPYRGKTNSPAYVPHVAAGIAAVRGVPVEDVASLTSRNFDRLFTKVHACAG